jgi:hypothetical protein
LDPPSRCCEYGEEKCNETYFDDADYFCSTSYNDTAYALAGLCPKRVSNNKCGDKQFHLFNRMNAIENSIVTNLLKGEHCTFKI